MTEIILLFGTYPGLDPGSGGMEAPARRPGQEVSFFTNKFSGLSQTVQ